jgi:hypothetical protein
MLCQMQKIDRKPGQVYIVPTPASRGLLIEIWHEV